MQDEDRILHTLRHIFRHQLRETNKTGDMIVQALQIGSAGESTEELSSRTRIEQHVYQGLLLQIHDQLLTACALWRAGREDEAFCTENRLLWSAISAATLLKSSGPDASHCAGGNPEDAPDMDLATLNEVLDRVQHVE